MLNDILTVGTSVLTLLLLMAVGYVLAKLKMLTASTLSQLSAMLLYVVCPVIMINTLLGAGRSPETVRALLIAAAVLGGTYILNMLIIQPFFRRAGRDDRGVLRFGSIYSNCGFMGIPLIQAVLGDAGMIASVTCLVAYNVCIWTHGAIQVGGKERASVKKALLNPGIIGFLIAILLFALQPPLPSPVSSVLTYVGSLNTPLAMIVIGGQMASVNLRELVRDKRLYGAAAMKLVVIPLVSLLVMLPFGLDPVLFVAVVILAGCPTAGATSLMCQTMGKDPSLAARLVTFSTILSVITLPIMAAIAQAVC